MNKSSEKRNLSQLYRPPPPEDYSQNYCRLTTVIALATIFIAVEVVGGVLSGSIAIISDAIHLVSDLIGFVFSILFLYLSKKAMDKKVTFGYHRMELIGAQINIFIVWAMVLFIMYEATLRIINKQFVKQPAIMLITAGAGLIINIALYKILHGGSSHSHGLLNDHECADQHDHQHDHEHDHQHQHQRNHQHKHDQHEHKHNEHKHEHSGQCKNKHGKGSPKGQLSAPLLKQRENPRPQCQQEKPKHVCQGNHSHHNHDESQKDPTKQEHDHQHHKNENHQHQHKNCKGHGHQHKDHVQIKSDGIQNQYEQHCVHQHKAQDQQVKHQSIGMKSAIIHALSDLVQSVGVVISALVIYFFGSNNGAQVTEWNAFHLFDPIATYIFSILSLLATIPVIHNCYYLVLESAPNHIDLDELRQEFQKIDGVIDVHDIHVWDLKPGKTVMMAHVLAREGTERSVLMSLTDLSRRKKVFHSTFQVQEELKHNNDYILCNQDIH